MRNFPSGCLAVIAVLFTLALGVGGGCFVGAAVAPKSDEYGLQWAVNGALIGGAAGLIGGLMWAFAIVRKRAEHSDEDER
jgi:hypothetical protein